MREVVERGTILRATVGSTVHGLHHGGQDDRDEMAVFLEPPGRLLGLLGPIEHYVERTQPEGVRSGPGDLDLVAYSLRKWLRLASRGHPTILLLLFVPLDQIHVLTPRGEALRDLAPAILSRKAAHGYVGYLRGQRQRLLGGGSKRVNRPELVAAHGFDTKYAMHAVRLGFQGLELVTTGALTLPMPEPARSQTMAVRLGEVPLPEVLALVEDLERRLLAAIDDSPLALEPRRPLLDAFLEDAYREFWRI